MAKLKQTAVGARMKIPCSVCGQYSWVDIATDPETLFITIPELHCSEECEVTGAIKLIKEDNPHD